MTSKFTNRVIALGTFDGLHPGHRAVIETCVRFAKETDASSLVYTFWESPKVFFGGASRNLLSAARKLTEILKLGADEVAADHFDRALSMLSPEDFVSMLITRFQAIAFVCGQDYTFGAGGKGDSQTLATLAARHKIQTIVVPTVKVVTQDGHEGEKVSSTLIRKALDSGDIDTAERLLRGEAI